MSESSVDGSESNISKKWNLLNSDDDLEVKSTDSVTLSSVDDSEVKSTDSVTLSSVDDLEVKSTDSVTTSSVDDSEDNSPETVGWTLVLVGRTGNGKSATGNSILGRKAFRSVARANGVTTICELQTTEYVGGRIINVIDTPGYFDFSAHETLGDELVKCIDLAKNGIHAVLLVLSVRARFSQEEQAAVYNLITLFGDKLLDYMILVFTGGDDLEDNDQSLDDYLSDDCPPPLKKILDICGDGRVLFDNKTKDEEKKTQQVEELFLHVNRVLSRNGGRPFTDALFDLRKGAEEFRDHSKAGQEQKTRQMMVDMMESRMKEGITRLEQQLAESNAATLKAEERALEAQRNSNEQIRLLKEILDKEKNATKEVRERSKEQIEKLEESFRKKREETDELKKKADEEIENLKERLELTSKDAFCLVL